jgi:hypothetical protein
VDSMDDRVVGKDGLMVLVGGNCGLSWELEYRIVDCSVEWCIECIMAGKWKKTGRWVLSWRCRYFLEWVQC